MEMLNGEDERRNTHTTNTDRSELGINQELVASRCERRPE